MSQQLSIDEIRALSEKIEAFAASLDNRERDAFAAALWNGEEGAEVSGYADVSPLGKNFLDLKFTTGASKNAFPIVKNPIEPPVLRKAAPSPWE
ncbi:MAG: hypothetical protein R2733_09090 [Acidimicrobiales bacterium]